MIESTKDFCARIRRALEGPPEGAMLRLPAADAARLGVSRGSPADRSVVIAATLVRRALEALEKGTLSGALADLPEPKGPPGSTLAERLELAAAEWAAGAAGLRKKHAGEGGLELWNHAATLQRASEELRANLRDPSRAAERARHIAAGWVATAGSLTRCLDGSTAPSTPAVLREAEVLRTCADRVAMILRTAEKEAADRAADLELGTAEPGAYAAEGIEQSFGKVAAVDTIGSMTRRDYPPSVVYSDDIEQPGGLFLAGELDSPLGDIEAQLRAAALFWGGVRAELRAREQGRLGRAIDDFRAALVQAYQLSAKVSDVLHPDFDPTADEDES